MLYKSKTFNSFETIGYSCCIMMSIVIGPGGRFTHVIGYWTVWDRFYAGVVFG